MFESIPCFADARGAEDGGAPTQALQEVVSSVRNARAEYGIELGRRIPAQLIIADAALSSALQAEMPVLCSLAKLDEAQVVPMSTCLLTGFAMAQWEDVRLRLSGLGCRHACELPLPVWPSAKQCLKGIGQALACNLSLQALGQAPRCCAGCAGVCLLLCRCLFIIRREHSSGSARRVGSAASHGRWGCFVFTMDVSSHVHPSAAPSATSDAAMLP